MTERTDGQKDGGTDAVEMLKAHRPMIRRESARRPSAGREGGRAEEIWQRRKVANVIS